MDSSFIRTHSVDAVLVRITLLHSKTIYGNGCDLNIVSFPDRNFRARRKNGSGQLPIPFSFKCAGMLAHCSFLI